MKRRHFIACSGCTFSSLLLAPRLALAFAEQERHFVAEAARMKTEAVANGDQPFGAVVVRAGKVLGFGPSRVVVDRNPDAHAERVALWDAQKRLRSEGLAGCVMYSTSRPCSACEHALAIANLDRMYFGPDATDAGRPKRSS